MLRDPALLVLAAIVCVLGAVPPEAAGESAAGLAVLALLLVLLRAGAASRTPVPTLWLVLAVPAVLAARFADAPGASVEPLALAVLAAATGIAVATGDRKPTVTLVATMLAVAGAVAGARALYDVIWGGQAALQALAGLDVPDRERIVARLAEGRAYAGFATPASLGGFLSMSLPVTIAAAAASAGRRRGGFVVAIVLELAGLLAARSITALGALAAAAVALALAARARRLLAPAAGAVVLAALVLVARGGAVVSATGDDSPLRLRAGNVRVAFEIAREHPWMGVGPGGYAEAFSRYRRVADNEARHAHSLPAEVVAEWGIPAGGLLAIGFYVLFLGPLFRRRPGVERIELGIAVGLAAFAFQNLVDFTAFLPTGLLLAAILRGAAATLPSDPAPADPRKGLVLAGAAAVAAGVVACAGLAWNARFDARLAASAGDPGSEVALTTRAARLAPWNVDAAILRTQALLRSSRVAEASAEAERAVALSPVRAAARDLRAAVRAAAGDTPGALADTIEAVRLYPIEGAYRQRRDAWAARVPTAGTP